MLLRRVIEHVRTQNWTAVALDFVIVVVGVFIGIQVANWNETRSEAHLGVVYKNRIIADLKNDLTIHETKAAYYETVTESVLEADRLLAAPDPDPRALVVAAYRASEIINETANRATWEQIVSSGHLGLLPEFALENGLADYYRYDESADESFPMLQNSAYRKLVRSIIPLPVQLEIRVGCSDVTDAINAIHGFTENCEINVDDATLYAVAATLKTSAQLAAELRHQYSLVASLKDSANGNIELVRRILTMLENEGFDQ